MTRDPDDDIQRKRMDLALREANLGVHQAWTQKAEHYLNTADTLVKGYIERSIPEDEVEKAMLAAAALCSITTAISTFVQTGMMVEAEASNVQHLLGHQQHDEEQQAHVEKAREAVQSALMEAVQKMREQGIDAHPAPDGFPGIVIRPPSDRPDGPIG